MTSHTNEHIRKVTSELSNEFLREQLNRKPELVYHHVPQNQPGKSSAYWRIRLDMTYDSSLRVGLDIHGDVTLGRDQEVEAFREVFETFDIAQMGVSRRHAVLRPTDTHLYLVDLGSTNGTWLNGSPVGVNIPYSLSNGDIVRLGHLEFSVQFIKKAGHTATLRPQTDMAEVCHTVAEAITSQLEVEAVLKKAMEMAMGFTHADEITIWLVDEHSGELFLEAGRGLDDEHIQRLPVTDTLPGKVIRTGRPLRAHRDRDGERVKIKTGYLVDAALYVPLKLVEVTFGVMSAVFREPGRIFTDRDEKIMTVVADMTAIAIQNARMYQLAVRDANRRARILTALNIGLSMDVKNLAKSTIGYAGLLRGVETDNVEIMEIAEQVSQNGNLMAALVNRLVDLSNLSQELTLYQRPVDLVEVLNSVVGDIHGAAAAKQLELQSDILGKPTLIQGDSTLLYRSILNLLDNAIKFTPAQGQVKVSLEFSTREINIRVCDTGPGIPEEELGDIFERYYHGTSSAGSPAAISLGLDYVRATAEAHRGNISVRNLETGGAEFVLTLPGKLRLSTREIAS
ncbi:MAG: FHA domain-containing protein [Anaerolineae bacterium]|nr:FHA domain-containing protein [Anaerolineae bacterium]MBN8618574.1 FHA domain-containing protein [Anaerolineae bacterium]